MKKGPKIFIGIIIFIAIVIAILVGIYYAEFRPKVETTAVSGVSEVSVSSVAQKFTPQSIGINTKDLKENKDVKLNSKDLSNLAAYAVSKSPSASKYITGVKVQPAKDNKLDVYLTGKVKGVESQAKLTFNVKSENGKGVLHYDGGKVGFISIPQSMIFDKLRDNGYINVNKQTGDITINSTTANGLNIDNMHVSNSELNLALNKINQEKGNGQAA
ncbi:MAG: hypothetical protein ACRC6T_03340 [Sarcina sp.]